MTTPKDSSGDLILLGLVGWLFWPAIVYFLIKDALVLNAATGQPPEVIIPLRRRVILMAAVCAVDGFLVFVLAIVLLTRF